MIKNRLYGMATVVLLGLEMAIAKWVHDDFIRPYLGDVIAVILVYTFIRSFFKSRIKGLPYMALSIAYMVELAQLFKVGEIMGVQPESWLSVVLGSTFDMKDILCYSVGAVLLLLIENVENRYAIRAEEDKNDLLSR